MDSEQDKKHPTKRFRPIASGVISIPLAIFTGIILASVGVTFAFILSLSLGISAFLYIIIQILYSVRLKHIIFLDVGCISSGFILRILAGTAALGSPISPWLYICSGLGALFVAISKRRSELSQAGNKAGDQRISLDIYTVPILDQISGIVATAAFVSYTLYTFTAENLPSNHSMMLTIPFVLYGLFRYIYIVHTSNMGEKPEYLIRKDFPMIITICLWTITAIISLLFGR